MRLHFTCLLTLLFSHGTYAMEIPKQSPKIIVVGAGLAGLTTAYRLHQAGNDVDVYEARSRVGGRVFTVKVCGALAEMGAANILDGGDAENLMTLISELELQTEGDTRLLDFYYQDSDRGYERAAVHATNPYSADVLMGRLTKAASQAANMKEVLDALFNKEDILYKVNRLHLAAYEGSPPEKLSTVYIKTLYHMLSGGVSSVHPGSEQEVSTIDFLVVKDGNSQLPEKLAQKLADRIHLNRPLKSFQKKESGSYQLTFEGGSSVTADIVVLAVPCSVYEDIEFADQVIPEDRLSLMKKVQYGTNAKILIPMAPTNTCRKVWMNGRVVVFFNRDQRVLNIYATNDFGLFTPNTIQTVYERDKEMLEKVYAFAPEAQTAVVAEDGAFAAYDSAVGYSWPLDPYAKGSYTCIGAGQEDTFCSFEKYGKETVKSLFAPIDGTLFFAGEHATIQLDIGGTMEAAVESGERTARMILRP